MSVRPIEPGEAAQAAATLADAFADDPLMCWAGGFDDGSERLHHLFRAVIARRFRRPESLVWCTPDTDAVAVWDGPGEAGWSVMDGIRSQPAVLRSFHLGAVRFLRSAAAMARAHPAEPHYYLLAVGVRQGGQGRGLGSSVLRPMLDRCDGEGLPAYLENSKPQNEAFYARLGFTAMPPFDLPKGAPPVMPMWREPR
ncbi:MAG: GNAT family N-acetyltransferase [Actinomycetota bacterium]